MIKRIGPAVRHDDAGEADRQAVSPNDYAVGRPEQSGACWDKHLLVGRINGRRDETVHRRRGLHQSIRQNRVDDGAFDTYDAADRRPR
jgi:hypothetical protein